MEVKERNELPEETKWDLTGVYTDDKAWEEEFKTLDSYVEKLEAFNGKLDNAKTIRDFYELEIEISRKLNKLGEYAMLRHSEDVRESAAQSMNTRISSKWAEIAAELSFAEPEILALDDESLKIIASSDEMKEHAFNFNNLIRNKAHTLSKEEEKLLASLSEVLGAPREIADQLQDADMVFDSVKMDDGTEIEVTGSNFVALQMGSDRALREKVFKSFYKGYKQHINTYAATYQGAVKAATIEAKTRHFNSSREMSLFHTNIPESVYDNLITAVRKHMDTMHRYVALRKKILKVDELHFYDVYAPLVSELDVKYSYDEAKQMVLDAVSPMGEDYVNTVKKAYADRWIDVYPNKGKSGGAYSAGGYDTTPYILMNFTGTLDSVSTLAHEMGHSMHTWHSVKKQPPQYSGYTLFVAEVASTVNENLLIEQLLSEETDPAKRLYLLNQYMEGFKGTVYRQTMFAEFEKEAHLAALNGEAINAEFLNSLYKGLVKDYFGDEMIIDEEISYEWARIPHFYRPFYVYVYATGYSTAIALSEAILKEGEAAVKRYREFLSMGGSAYPLDELKVAGVDLTSPAPIEAALEKFERILADAEETYEKLNK